MFTTSPKPTGRYSSQLGLTAVLLACLISTGCAGLFISTQPFDFTTVEGQEAVFKVRAVSAETFQWYRNNIPIPGATQSELRFTASSADNGAVYKVVAGAIVGEENRIDTSDEATLTVLPAGSAFPTAMVSPAPGSVLERGENYDFRAQGLGIRYQVDILDDNEGPIAIDEYHNDLQQFSYRIPWTDDFDAPRRFKVIMTGDTGTSEVIYNTFEPQVAPRASSDNYGFSDPVIVVGDTVTIPAANGVLANDSDRNGDSLTARLVSQPVRGSVQLRSNGSFTFSDNGDPITHSVQVTFTYVANDGQEDSNPATVTLYISPDDNPPTTIPARPTNLAGSLSGTRSVVLTWNDNSRIESGFQIQYRPSTFGNQWRTQIVSVNVTTETILAEPGKRFDARVRAYNGNGNSSWSNTFSIQVPNATPPQAPDRPTNLAANADSPTTVQLNWRDNSDDEEGFIIQRRVSGGSWAGLAYAAADTTQFTDLMAVANTSYQYRIQSWNATDGSSWSNTASASTPGPASGTPTSPNNLSASKGAVTTVDLSWNDRANDETGYRIEQRRDNGVWGIIAEVPANTRTYNATGITNKIRYRFRVRAIKGSLASGYSNTASITPEWIPERPTNLRATSAGSSVTLNWNDNSSFETQFRVERKKDSDAWGTFRTVSANETTVSDDTVVNGSTYRYRVRALYSGSESGWSNVVIVSPNLTDERRIDVETTVPNRVWSISPDEGSSDQQGDTASFEGLDAGTNYQLENDNPPSN